MLMLFQPPLHPVSSDRAFHARNSDGKPQIMHARAKRKRSWVAIFDWLKQKTPWHVSAALRTGVQKRRA